MELNRNLGGSLVITRWLSGAIVAAGVTAGVVAGSVQIAQAAAPKAFKAHGDINGVQEGDVQSAQFLLYYQGGKVRLETDSKTAGKSILVASKGQGQVAMLDPVQKVVVRMPPAMLNGGMQGDEVANFQSMLDPAGFKTVLLRQGQRVGPGGGILGHRTTIFERSHKGNNLKVWFADDLSLPLRVEGHGAHGSHFALKITDLDLHPSFGAHDFDPVPPGYSEVKAETNN